MSVYISRSEFVRLLRERRIHPKKSLGQNFLVDASFLDAMVREMDLGRDDEVIEIGTGAGHLTFRLCDHAARVRSFEIDPALHELAVDLIGDRPNLRLILADGADFDRHVTPAGTRRRVLVSNLPYSDYARLLLRLLATPLSIESYFLMLQRDVYDRLRAEPGTRDYGPWSVLMQGLCEVRFLKRAGPQLFYPTPRVSSAFFRLKRVDPVRTEKAVPLFQSLRRLFSGRRKRLASVLRSLRRLGIELPPQAGDWADARVEALPPRVLIGLAEQMAE
ncbi:MAG: ribosomal RNA small subunit methyltransferase A [Planctomycetes bacterium]|nr:ribosomal RNA small subunit methyltransferase A [Planctomycetota bacterium]